MVAAPLPEPTRPAPGIESASPPGPASAERWSLASVSWALVPAITFGLGAAPCFVIAAIRLRRRMLGVAAVAYGCGYLLGLWLAGGDYPDSSWQSNVGLGLTFGVWLGSTVHAVMIGRAVFPRRLRPPTAVAAAKDRLRRRSHARRIVATDPVLARELGIGRPDIASNFDDGGLVDINHVPVEVLCRVEGIDLELALVIIDARSIVRGFESRDDLEVTVGLDPHVLDRADDLLLFCR